MPRVHLHGSSKPVRSLPSANTDTINRDRRVTTHPKAVESCYKRLESPALAHASHILPSLICLLSSGTDIHVMCKCPRYDGSKSIDGQLISPAEGATPRVGRIPFRAMLASLQCADRRHGRSVLANLGMSFIASGTNTS